MPIPEVDRERLEQALREYDETLRDTAEWQGWDERKSQKFAILENGRRYPPKKIVSLATSAPVGSFSGGVETNSYLEDRDFTIVTLFPRAISNLLDQILRDYPQARTTQVFGSEAPMYQLFEQAKTVLEIDEVLGERESLKVVASPGQGNWARVPWISFLDPRETESTQKGVYVVILFRQDGSGLYFTFNQGVTEPKNRLGSAAGIAEVRSRAAALRRKPWCKALESAGFRLDDSIDLHADPGLGRDYEASTVAHKFYERGSIPEDAQLLTDLGALLHAYDCFFGTDDEVPTIHLLLKWNASREPRTIQLHKAIAERQDSVWWGKFGTALGRGKVAQLDRQIAQGELTYVFLVGGDTTWRAHLLEITTDQAKVDDLRFPSYYTRQDCSIFCRLTAFEEVGTDWLLANTVLDSNPVDGSTSAILSNQSAFAYVRVIGGAWIFQANPQLFDVRAAVKQLTQFQWLVKQFGDKIKRGDRVYLWESGPQAGIVALGSIAEAVQDVEDDLASAPFRKQPEKFEGVQPRVLVRVERIVDPHLSRDLIKAQPELSELSILKMAQGTNFHVTERQRQAIDALLDSVKSPQEGSELCLLGTWKRVDETVARAKSSIREKGGWAHPWSFPIRPDAAGKLKKPFYLYINSGGGRFPVRLRIVDFVSSQGNEGQISPWPEITEPDRIGKVRVGDNGETICKTWLWADEVTSLSPELSLEDFEPVPGLSVASTSSLLSAVTFGYARLRSEHSMDALVSHTLLERDFLDEIVSSLTKPVHQGGSPQIILAGPPGTSKTWVAEAIAQHIAKQTRNVRLVQFHPNYSYESFVEGLRPKAEGGGIKFEFQPGVLLSFVQTMTAAGEGGEESPLYVLVIDEMNRANLPRVFGELMYLFEYRDKAIRLQYSENFSLPKNLCFIGTMNTADRSIRSIDIALRRRFDVFELRPNSGVLRRFFEKNQLNVANLIEGFEELNRQLAESLDRHHTIGHAFFMKPGLDYKLLRAIWDRKIYPLIEEYFFDQLDIAKKEYVFEKFWPV